VGIVLSIARVPAHAATTTITVTGTGDSGSPPVCTTSCTTLRGAVAAANALTTSSGSDVVIVLPSGTINLTAGELDIASSTNTFMTVQGPVPGNPAAAVVNQQTAGFGAFVVALGANITTKFQDLTISGGTANNSTFGGGAILSGDTGDQLTLTDCVITGNSSSASAGGGGVLMSPGGSMTITNSTISNNHATVGFAGGVGIANDGGHGASVLTISNSSITGNSSTDIPNGAPFGGGVYFQGGGNAGSSISITQSVFSGNTAGTASTVRGKGGAIFADGPGSITLSTLTGNTATNGSLGNGLGGAVWHNTGALTVSTSRIVGNTASTGGGLYQDTNAGTTTADNDWWGTNAGAGGAVATGGTGGVTPSTPHWLQLRNVPTTAALHPGDTTALTADILGRNTGGALGAGSLNGLASFPVPAGTIFSNAVHGSLSGASTQFVNGVATTTFNSNLLLGNASADAMADSQTVTANLTVKADTTTAVTSNHNPSVFGQGVQFTATVSSNTGGTTPATPQGGTVQFMDGVTNLGSPVSVVSGVATTPTIANLSVGNHTITAVYSGDVDFNGSAGSLGTNPQVVNKADTSVAVGSSLNPSVVTQTVQFTATITATAPGAGTPAGVGSVQFKDNGNPLGAAQTPVGGVASISTNTLTVGTHTITAVYAGDGNFNGSTGTLAGGQVVNKAPTTTTIVSPHNPSVFGQPVDFTATVQSAVGGTITGNVQFAIDGVNQGSALPVTAGSATLSGISNLSVGNHVVTATYGSDATFDVSTGTLSGGQTVNKASTTTALGSSPNPSNVNQPVAFTATVTATAPGAGTPTGNVQFVADGSTTLGTIPLAGGVATLSNVTSLTLGTHPVVATYVGDASFTTSTSSQVNQVVNGFLTTTTVTSSANPSVFGQTVMFTATVDSGGNGTPTGSVQFGIDGSNVGGPIALSGGVGTYAAANLPVGNHGVTATFTGAGSYIDSSGTLPGGQTVNPSDTSTGVSSSVNPSVFGQPVTFTATVAPTAPGAGTPSGTIDFFVDGSPLSSVPLASGSATTTPVANLPVGTHTVTTTYTGDTSFHGSAGTLAGGQVVAKADTTTTVGSSANPSVSGQGVSFTATVAPVAPGAGTPTGNVSFFLNGAPLQTQALSAGAATTSSISNLAVGSYAVTATYGGDTSFNTSSSPTLTQVVKGADTTTTVTTATSPTVFGQPVTFTATVAPVAPASGTPTGQVEFFADGSSFGTATVTAGSATSPSISTLAVGSHTVTATYGGDASFNTSTGSVGQQVNHAGVTVTVTSAQNPSVFGETVTYAVTVTAVAPGAGVPTGSVVISDLTSGQVLGAAPLTGGVGTLADNTLHAGAHVIAAFYPGDTNFAPQGGFAGHQVNPAGTTTALSSSANPSAFGQGVSFTATVAPVAPGAGTPTGTVQFFVDGSAFGGPVTLAGGTGTSGVTSALSVGTHPVTATYSGNGDFNPSTSAALDQVVGQIDATNTVTSSVNPSVFGQPVVFTATLTGAQGTPTGSIQFGVDGVNLGGPVGLAGGVATSTAISSLSVGAHTVTATYRGDIVYKPGTGSLTQTVNKADTTTSTASSANPSDFGEPVQFTATVAALSPGAGTPGGQVQFVVDGSNLGGPVSLSGGVATSGSISTLGVGSHTVSANYLGDASFNTSSGSLSGGEGVQRSDSTTTVSSSQNPSAFGQGVQFTAHVAAAGNGAGTPGGTVQFVVDGSNVGGPVTLSGGSATSGSISTLSVGNHTVRADYSGSGNFKASSGTLPGGQTVTKAGASVAVASSKNPSVLGDSVVFTATVTPVAPGSGTPTGQVQFVIDGANAGSPAAVSGGVGTYSTSGLAVGNHTVVANYGGDASFAPASGTLAGGQTVAAPAMADLSVTKVGAARAVVDLPTAYAVVVTNNGPNNATGVVMVDTLPAGWTVLAKVTTQGTCTTALPTVSCAIGNLAVGAHATVTLVVVPHATGSVTNTASVKGDQVDPNPHNNTASVTTTVRRFGYWLFGSDGGVFTFGDAAFFGSTGSMHLNRPVVAMTPTPLGQGYWLFGSDGGVFAFGDAGFFGSMAGIHINGPIVAMTPTPLGQGYWLFGSDGGVFAFGDAGFFGSKGSMPPGAPIVAMSVTPSGQGYWLAGSDGAVFPFGDAGNLGSLAGTHLNAPIVGIAGTPSGQGYWLVASDGGVLAFGDAGTFGGLGGTHLNSRVVGIAATPDGQGYWLVAADGGVFGFGNAPFLGGMGGQHLNKPIGGLVSSG